MINDLLQKGCYEFQRRLSVAYTKLQGRPMLPEVEPCYEWVVRRLNALESEVHRIESLLNKGIQDIVLQQTWYSELSTLSNQLSFLDQYFLDPLYRLKGDDLLALKMLRWLHMTHPQTKNHPFVVSNGSFSVATSATTPTIYFIPVTSEASFLHLPLFFHEYGHKLFLQHRKELEDLISELQVFLADHLQPLISQDDEKYIDYERKATEIVETWREWMEELFCDAVGLHIGGPSYLYAFSLFTLFGGMKEYFVPERQLPKRSHPVSILRIRFLVKRAVSLGWAKEATMLENEWRQMAKMLNAREDYFGYFEPVYEEKVFSIINDMLEEVNPIAYKEGLLSPGSYLPIIDEAWKAYKNDPINFQKWEVPQIEKALSRI